MKSQFYAIIDSQNIKTVYASYERGTNGGKKVKGRKRHISTDTEGNMLAIFVYTANIHDTKGGMEVASQTIYNYESVERFCGDEGCRGTCVDYVAREFDMEVDISERITPKFVLFPKRVGC